MYTDNERLRDIVHRINLINGHSDFVTIILQGI